MAVTRNKRGPRGGIDAEVLLASGEKILRAKGLRGLSLRAVTAGAGITPTVLYTYFADLAQLRNQLGDRFLATIDLGLLFTGSPSQALNSFMDHVIERFQAEPGYVELLAAQPIVGPNSLALNEALLGFFIERVGHSAQRAASVTVLLTEWLHGHMLLMASDLGPGPPARDNIPAADFPLTREMLRQEPGDWALRALITAVTLSPQS
ncbi:TetR/AcrR family transcriptional regulator [Corynebacterium flavescens]|uniref:TetR/AcrR family transcriptional regulator n=1 Tax=Corynebacterium flavescens TaxID=28028 RepID=UPI003F8F72CC